jgi:hypothetical protein
MATTAQLVLEGVLHKVEDVLEPHEQEERLLYVMPRAKDWMDANLSDLAADGFYENAPSPEQQVYDLFYSFLSGDPEISEWTPHPMRPQEHGIWELRTADLRFFGWFWRKSIFIISAVDQKSRCEEFRLYEGYRNQCSNDREALGLEPPPFVNGELESVL